MIHTFTHDEMKNRTNVYFDEVPETIEEILSIRFYDYIHKIIKQTNVFKQYSHLHSQVIVYNGLYIEIFDDKLDCFYIVIKLCEKTDPKIEQICDHGFESIRVCLDCNTVDVLKFDHVGYYSSREGSVHNWCSSYEWFVHGKVKAIAIIELENLFKYFNCRMRLLKEYTDYMNKVKEDNDKIVHCNTIKSIIKNRAMNIDWM
jgi:hypothetical protein